MTLTDGLGGEEEGVALDGGQHQYQHVDSGQKNSMWTETASEHVGRGRRTLSLGPGALPLVCVIAAVVMVCWRGGGGEVV